MADGILRERGIFMLDHDPKYRWLRALAFAIAGGVFAAARAIGMRMHVHVQAAAPCHRERRQPVGSWQFLLTAGLLMS